MRKETFLAAKTAVRLCHVMHWQMLNEKHRKIEQLFFSKPTISFFLALLFYHLFSLIYNFLMRRQAIVIIVTLLLRKQSLFGFEIKNAQS